MTGIEHTQGATAPPTGSRGGTVLRDTRTAFRRQIIPELREPVGILFSMAQPLLFLAFFGPLLSGFEGFGQAGAEAAWQWFIPSVLVMMCIFGPMMSGYTLLTELMGGAMERLLVTPMNRTAMLVGRTMKESVILLVQALLIIAIGIPLGFEPHLLGAVLAVLMLVVFATGLSALSAVLAIHAAPSGSLFYIVTQMLMFPLLLLSGILLPMDAGPQWLQVLSQLNPFTYLAEAQRALFDGALVDPAVAYGGLAALAVAVVGLALGTRAMRSAV